MTTEQLNELRADPKTFLMKGWNLHNKVEAKLDRINHWRQIAESITAEIKPTGGFGGGKTESKVENCVANIVDLQNEIKDDVNALIDTENVIKEAISMVPDKNNMRLLLELRHLNYYSWENVSVCIGRSYRWVLALYERCLEFFKRL